MLWELPETGSLAGTEAGSRKKPGYLHADTLEMDIQSGSTREILSDVENLSEWNRVSSIGFRGTA